MIDELEQIFKSRSFYNDCINSSISIIKEDKNYYESWFIYYDTEINKTKIPICSISDLYLFLQE